jgi:hypothetical protein
MSNMSNLDRKTVWVCKVTPDHIIRLEDIPMEEWTPLEKQLTESWITMIGAPLRNTEMVLAVYQLCCRTAGVTPESGMAAGKVLAMFELVDDDRPDYWSAGLPDPKADAQTTVG